MNAPIETVDAHLRRFFQGHSIVEQQWTLGPVPDKLPDFRVLSVAPGPKTNLWTYVSRGASQIEPADGGRLEFFLLAPDEDLLHVELVTMVTWYHLTKTLGRGHTAPIGRPWLPGSLCDHLLISTPYPFGPELEICNFPGGHAHVLWVLPVTQAERDFKVDHDLEALEQKFEEAAIEYWNPGRRSVV